jgi:hypothetical protein
MDISPKEANSLASTLPLIELPPCPPQWGPMPFAVFTAMVGGNVPLEGIKGVRRFGVANPSSEHTSKTILLHSLWIFGFFKKPYNSLD